MMGKSEELLERAIRVIPGGVNSPVSPFRRWEEFRVISKAKGVTDEDGIIFSEGRL